MCVAWVSDGFLSETITTEFKLMASAEFMMMFYTLFAYSTRLTTYEFEEVNDLFLNFRIVIGTIVIRIINSPSKPPIINAVNGKFLNLLMMK